MINGRRFKIALFIPTLDVGGAERVLITLARGLAERGHSVYLVVAGGEGSFLDHVPTLVKVQLLNKSRLASSLLPLAKWIRDVHPDVVISALDAANAIAISAVKMSARKIPVVPTVHHNVSRALEIRGGLKQRIINRIAKVAYRGASSIVCVSQGVADDLIGAHGVDAGKVTAIPNPVVTPEMLENLGPRKIRHEQRVQIVAAGRFDVPKDFATIIRAFRRVHDELDSQLVILGDGPMRRELESLVADLKLSDHVAMPGFVDNVTEYLRESDAFVLSSHYEGLPTVIIEALASGCPVVSTDCPFGPAELLEYGRLGHLVPIGDDAAMAAAIIQSIREPISKALLREGSRRYSMDFVCSQYERLIDEAVDRSTTQVSLRKAS